jgi:hypothetical protein
MRRIGEGSAECYRGCCGPVTVAVIVFTGQGVIAPGEYRSRRAPDSEQYLPCIWAATHVLHAS